MSAFLTTKQLTKDFFFKGKQLRAVNGVSFSIQEGETLGMVGESGSGKSTLGKMLLNLTTPTCGEVIYQERNIFESTPKEQRELKRHFQMIFQDPFASLNPRMSVEQIVAEPMVIHRYERSLIKDRVKFLLQQVGLEEAHLQRFPHELSGGQRQRVCIARALSLTPSFIVCDEAIAALDLPIQLQIVKLLEDLQREWTLTYLFISHDLSMVRYLSDRIAVMYMGSIVELAPTEELFSNPLHPYTKMLLDALPIPDPQFEKKRQRSIVYGEPPSPFEMIQGCPFSSRCPHANQICHTFAPKLKEVSNGHFVACYLSP